MERIRQQVADPTLRVTQHAAQEMAEEDIVLDDVLDAIGSGEVLEDYPTHRRGACCLVHGVTRAGRPLHVICTTLLPVLIIITVYEPRPPKMGDAAATRDTSVRCSLADCPGGYDERLVTHTVRRRGQLVVFDHVPADVCSVCGDVLLKPETVRRIEAMLASGQEPAASVPLYEYAR